MYFYSKLTYKVPIRIPGTAASIDTVHFRRILNGLLQNENVSEEGQDVVEESKTFTSHSLSVIYRKS